MSNTIDKGHDKPVYTEEGYKEWLAKKNKEKLKKAKQFLGLENDGKASK